MESGIVVEVERPQASLLELNGSLHAGASEAKTTEGICISNMALRGCELHNTNWVLGVVCYVGDDTKVRLNSAEPPHKISDVAVLLNNCVVAILAAILII